VQKFGLHGIKCCPNSTSACTKWTIFFFFTFLTKIEKNGKGCFWGRGVKAVLNLWVAVHCKKKKKSKKSCTTNKI
jgi:hypothetical protein